MTVSVISSEIFECREVCIRNNSCVIIPSPSLSTALLHAQSVSVSCLRAQPHCCQCEADVQRTQTVPARWNETRKRTAQDSYSTNQPLKNGHTLWSSVSRRLDLAQITGLKKLIWMFLLTFNRRTQQLSVCLIFFRSTY